MKNLEIYCTSIKYYNIIDKLPAYIKPLGLGANTFPKHWLVDNIGDNISHLNKHYGELTGIYWIWKNNIKNLSNNDLIGNCHYRKLWLNNKFVNKQKKTFESLYQNLLSEKNEHLDNCDSLQVQPIKFKSKNLLEDFKEIHKCQALLECLDFLDNENKEKFRQHLNGHILFPLNMFITKVIFFREYCEIIFPWLEKCLNYCRLNNLLKDYNIRLPAFLAERFTSYWFSQYNIKNDLSYARLGNFFLSNNINKIINPIKLPFTFKMYPTIHNY
jgi:hypothetical protein